MNATDLVGAVVGARIELRDARRASEEAHAVYRAAVEAERRAHSRYMSALTEIEKAAAETAGDLAPEFMAASSAKGEDA